MWPSVRRNELHNFLIEKKLFLNHKGARLKYDHYLEQGREAQDISDKTKKKNIIHDKTVLVKKKKKDLIECIASHGSDIIKCRIESEAKRDFTLLTKANSFWKTKTEKEKSTKALNVALEKLKNDIKAWSE